MRHQTGPFDVIGDVDGCRIELEQLLTDLGYAIARDDTGRAMLRMGIGMVEAGNAFRICGNHGYTQCRSVKGVTVGSSVTCAACR